MFTLTDKSDNNVHKHWTILVANAKLVINHVMRVKLPEYDMARIVL